MQKNSETLSFSREPSINPALSSVARVEIIKADERGRSRAVVLASIQFRFRSFRD